LDAPGLNIVNYEESENSWKSSTIYSQLPFCVPAKVIKLVGLKNGGRVSPTNLITFVGTQNGE
jgi:hypothetical protein